MKMTLLIENTRITRLGKRSLVATTSALCLAIVLAPVAKLHSSENVAIQEIFALVERSAIPRKQLKALEELAAIQFNNPLQTVRVRSDLAQRTMIQTPAVLGHQLTVTRTKLDTRVDGYSWFGTIDPNDPKGHLVITVVGDSIGGTLVLPERSYALKPLGAGLSALAEIDPSRFPPDHPQVSRASTGALPQRTRLPESTNVTHDVSQAAGSSTSGLCSLPVSVLVLYTPQVAAAIGNLSWFAQSAIDVSNQSFANSNITGGFALAGTIGVNYQGITISKDLQNLRSGNAAPGNVAHAMRDQLFADVVVLLTESSDACGEAAAIHSPESDGYAVVYYSCAVDNLSFPHEIGHLIGNRHNPEADGTNSPYKYGHGTYRQPAKYRTVMSYPCPAGNCVRVPYWSNPDVKYKGRGTGDKSKRNNSRVTNENMCRVSKFRVACPPAVWFSGSKQASFDGANCYLGPVPSGSSPFVYQNRYYISSTGTTNCPIGQYDGANCLVMAKPATGFIYQDRFYKKYDACKLGQNDSANCYLGDAPPGTTAFTYQGAYYHTPANQPNMCPLPGSFFDTANCFVVSAAAGGFRIGAKFYTSYNACGTGTDDSANCLLIEAPWGTHAFEYQGGFYITPLPGCSDGSFDGANCLMGSPPPGYSAFIWQGGYYYQ